MTPAQRKRLAAEARKLAMECVNGDAPELDPWSYCGCACAEIVKRGLGVWDPNIAQWVDELLMDPTYSFGGLVSLALLHHGADSLPFPLLALADAIEDARSAK